ncbi:MAG: hypothetical protein HFE84_03280 [Lachnospiraceae bacterium]|nr:hypothetical protein [Lachnospiraceae bacterium]
MMEELYKELLLEVTKVLQKRYNHMAEARRLTEEIAGELQRDDRVNVQMLLEMRETEINALRENDRSLRLLLENTPGGMGRWLEEAVAGKMLPESADEPEKARLLRLAVSIRSAWEKTMLVDRRMNMRLGGRDSFYADK